MQRARRPDAVDLKRVLGGLVQCPVKVGPASGPSPEAVYAGYQDAEGRFLAVLATDLEFAAASGAAIGMIAPDVVAEVVKEGELPRNLQDNYREVANVLASLLCGQGWAHVRLTDLHVSADAAPEAMRALLEGDVRTSPFEVSFERYGAGRAFFHLA